MAGSTEVVYTFSYLAVNAAGEKTKGTARATSRIEVLNELDRRGLIPHRVTGGPGSGAEVSSSTAAPVKHKALVMTTRMLAEMFEADLDPLQIIDIVILDCEDRVLKEALIDIRGRMENGIRLSLAMEQQGTFPSEVVYAVRSGEASGDLKGALMRVALQFERSSKIRAKVRKALIYPAVLSTAITLVFAYMVVSVVPSMTESLKDLGGPGAQLPWVTRFTLALGELISIAGPIAVVILVLAGWWFRKHRHEDAVRARVDPIKLSLPIFGTLLHKLALARFCSTLSGLLANGVERLESLEITAKVVGNFQMEQAVLRAREAQRDGVDLAEALREEPLFAPRVISMLSAGEAAGKVDRLLAFCGSRYDDEVEEMSDNMTALITPIITPILAVVIGLIGASIYLPYLSLLTMA